MDRKWNKTTTWLGAACMLMLLSAANATALALGSIGGAAIVAVTGFEVALLATLIGLLGAGLVATRDPGLHRLPIRAPDIAAVADA